MTERERPWWMLHWPSWLALVVFGGAFGVLNLVAAGENQTWKIGWPFTMCRLETQGITYLPGSLRWVWEVQSFKGVGQILPEHDSWPDSWPPTFYWDALGAGLNLAIGVVVAVGVVVFEERNRSNARTRLWTFEPQVSVRRLLGGVTFVAVFTNSMHRFMLPAGFVGLLITCLGVSLALGTLIDFIGWLFGRLTKREA